MTVERELRTIYEKYHGLEPEVVVSEAEPMNHPLHASFEWDDSVAGHQHRLHQARALIRSVTVRLVEADEDHGPTDVRAYLPVPNAEGRSVYTASQEIAQSPQLSEFVLTQMERDWRRLRRKWGAHREFFDFIQTEVDGNSKTG